MCLERKKVGVLPKLDKETYRKEISRKVSTKTYGGHDFRRLQQMNGRRDFKHDALNS